MSKFGDQLRENLAHRGAEARAATEAKSAQAEAASIGLVDADDVAAALVVGVFRPLDRDSRPGPTSGAVHHVALRCEGHEEMVARLKARGLEHAQNDVRSINLKQIFVVDPNGVMLELNFFAG